MKRIFGVAAVLAILAAGVVGPASAAGTCAVKDTCIESDPPCEYLFEFDANSHAYETNYNTATYISQPGSEMTIVSLITLFGPAMPPTLDPTDPTKEYTLVISGLVSKGTLVSTIGPITQYTTNYDSLKAATFALYEDSPRDVPRSFAEWDANPFGGGVVPDYFEDGTVLLSGDLCGFTTQINTPGGASFRANYNVTGGTLYPYIPGGAESVLGGVWCATLAGCTPANYTAQPDGKFDASRSATPAVHASWGRLKQIYR